MVITSGRISPAESDGEKRLAVIIVVVFVIIIVVWLVIG